MYFCPFPYICVDFYNAVWRHVIEKNDPVDELSLSLGKCESNFLFPFGGMFLIRTIMLVVFVFLICF